MWFWKITMLYSSLLFLFSTCWAKNGKLERAKHLTFKLFTDTNFNFIQKKCIILIHVDSNWILSGWLINNRKLVLTFQRLGKLRQRYWKIWCLARTASWFIDCCPLAVSLHGRRGERDLWGLLDQSITHSWASISRPNQLWKPHLLLPSYWGSGFQHVNLRGSQIFSLWYVCYLHVYYFYKL